MAAPAPISVSAPVPAPVPEAAPSVPVVVPYIPVMGMETNSLMLTLDMLRRQGYGFVEIKTTLGDTFYAVLDNILYWSSNLVPSMFTPVYGSCDFRVRGSFNGKHNWNDMSDIDRILSGSDGLELSSVVISSHRNLIRDTDNFGMLKVLHRVERIVMGEYVFFDQRSVDKDTAHAAFGQAESLSYEGKDDVYDHVLNSKQIVSIVPFFVHEEVSDKNIINAYWRMYPDG